MGDTTQNRWTADEDEKLRLAVRRPGVTAAQIANEIGRSRNAVIGRALRLGLRLPGAVGPMGTLRVTRPKPPKPRLAGKPVDGHLVAKLPPYREPEEPPPRATARPGASNFRECQWYFGDPKAGDMSKCCQPTAGASSFCEEHHARVYVPAQPIRMKRRA